MAMSQIRQRMVHDLAERGAGIVNILAVIITGAILIVGHVHNNNNPTSLGADFARGHEMLPGSIDLPMGSFQHAITTGWLNEQHATSLCASTGAVNIGVHGGHLYLLYKWLVGV